MTYPIHTHILTVEWEYKIFLFHVIVVRIEKIYSLQKRKMETRKVFDKLPFYSYTFQIYDYIYI
jgi:hypothetical protein